MAQLYRKSALDKISSPEQLDKALTITSPMSWLALAAVTLIIVVTVIWAFIGSIPVTVTANGVITSADSTNAVYGTGAGTVQNLFVQVGTEVKKGSPIIEYMSGNEINTIYSDQYGRVTALLVNTGEKNSIKNGDEIVRITPIAAPELQPSWDPNAKRLTVCYVNWSDADKIHLGDEAAITLSGADSQSHGHMSGRVICIDSHTASSAGMSYVLGADWTATSTFDTTKGLVAVTLELYPDVSTASGYYWSNEKGKSLVIQGTPEVSVKITVEEVKPITKLLYKLKEIWGD